MPDLPTGTVTFLFTDLEGSTRLWEQKPEAMRAALARHDAILRHAIGEHHGVVFSTMGDGMAAAFASAPDALAAALGAQQNLGEEDWVESGPLLVRMGVHSDEGRLRAHGEYVNRPLNRCARLMGVAHGGQVLVSNATAVVAGDGLPSGASLLDLGEHRLRDLADSVQVFQLVHPDLRSDFPPLRSLDTVPGNLPSEVTTFVGREQEIATLSVLVRERSLVTLTGVGGVGKTRLALQVAAEAVSHLPDGVWFVDLASLSDPSLVLPAVAQALGIHQGLAQSLPAEIPEPARALAQLVVEHVHSKRLLLVLDNCEHLLGACAQVTEMLLRACPKVRILCTSREPLGVGAEATWRVPSLAVPDPERLPPLDELAASEAVRLFLERAAQKEASFTLSAESAPAVAQICQRLDGIPLAIELAAARIRVLTPEQIATRLDDRFTLLTGGSRAALERHQTLRAAVDWSFDTLSETEQALLRRTSVFAGGFSLEAVEAACTFGVVSSENVVDLLSQLIDKSLLQMETHRERARYRLLETIRQYSRDQLVGVGEVEEQRSRHQHFFLAMAERTERRMWGDDQGAAMDELNDDADNVAQAVAWSLARGEWEVALRLAGALDRFWSAYRPSQGRRLLEEALEGGPGEASFARARALSAAGLLASISGDGVPARRHLEESLALYRHLGVRRGVVWALINLAILDSQEDRLSEMGAHLHEALPLARESGHPQTIGWALTYEAFLALRRGDYDRERSAAEEALGLFRRCTDQTGIAFALTHLAGAFQGQGDYTSSDPLLDEAVALQRSLGGVGPRLMLGHSALARGDLESARAFYQESADFARERSMSYAYVVALIHLGEVALAAGNLDEAAARYAAALGGGNDLPPPALLCWIVSGGAKLAMAQDQPECATRLLGVVEVMRDSLGIRLPPVIHSSGERCAELARKTLGAEEYEASRQAGGKLTDRGSTRTRPL